MSRNTNTGNLRLTKCDGHSQLRARLLRSAAAGIPLSALAYIDVCPCSVVLFIDRMVSNCLVLTTENIIPYKLIAVKPDRINKSPSSS